MESNGIDLNLGPVESGPTTPAIRRPPRADSLGLPPQSDDDRPRARRAEPLQTPGDKNRPAQGTRRPRA